MIVEAVLVLQIDDPRSVTEYDSMDPAPTPQQYRDFASLRIEALNHALAGLPEDRVRYHICWGSWHGPHTTDIPLESIVDLLLKVHAGAYSLEAANVRHELDWEVWRDVRLPDDKLLIPGVVSHATNVVEEPELVAERIKRYARLVGRERVIAGTDCGFGGRVHPQIAWAKLQVLGEGAALASQDLWARPTGDQVRRRVLGGAHVDRTAQQGDPFLTPFFEAGTEHIWGGLWNRPGLDLKFRSLAVVSTLAATGHLHELQTHLRGALNLGWTADELREALLQVGGYAGFPAAVEALRVLSQVVAA